MEINGVAHVMLTVNNFEACFPFYEQLLIYLGMKPVMRERRPLYCVGGRTAVGIMRGDDSIVRKNFNSGASGCITCVCARATAATSMKSTAFSKQLVRRLCIRRRTVHGRRGITRCCLRILMGFGSRRITCRERGCWVWSRD